MKLSFSKLLKEKYACGGMVKKYAKGGEIEKKPRNVVSNEAMNMMDFQDSHPEYAGTKMPDDLVKYLKKFKKEGEYNLYGPGYAEGGEVEDKSGMPSSFDAPNEEKKKQKDPLKWEGFKFASPETNLKSVTNYLPKVSNFSEGGFVAEVAKMRKNKELAAKKYAAGKELKKKGF